MHKVLFRLVDVSNKKTAEVSLDERLSFKENFKILEMILNMRLKEAMVYDPYKKIFLDRNIPLKSFGFKGFVLLYLFNRQI